MLSYIADLSVFSDNIVCTITTYFTLFSPSIHPPSNSLCSLTVPIMLH